MALNGTLGQFDVTWDAKKSAVNLIPGLPYTPAGGESAPGDGSGKGRAGDRGAHRGHLRH